jgi:flagellar basal-body rod modification protein FlgD
MSILTALFHAPAASASQPATLSNGLGSKASGPKAAAAGSSGSGSGSTSGTDAFSVNNLGSTFLNLLVQELQNQDPTSPMDSNQFTEELVEFTGVQQEVATNTSLTQLIGLQQGTEVLQSANVVGDTATVSATEIALQNSTGAVTFSAPQAEPVQIAIVNSAGAPIYDTSINAQSGTNTWTWNGLDNNGNQVPDGAYGVALETGTTGSNAAALPFSVVGTVTGLTNGSTGMQLQMGALSVGLSSVQGVKPQ